VARRDASPARAANDSTRGADALREDEDEVENENEDEDVKGKRERG